MLSQETINEFIQVVREDYDREITPEQASEILRNLVNYFDLLAKLNYRQKYDNENNQSDIQQSE